MIRSLIALCGIYGGHSDNAASALQSPCSSMAILIPATAQYQLIVLSSTLYLSVLTASVSNTLKDKRAK
jgi:hypothetical protein